MKYLVKIIFTAYDKILSNFNILVNGNVNN